MKKRIERFEDLIAWQKARVLTRDIYRVASQGEFARDFVMSRQIRSAALSVPSNSAEGFERGNRNEFHQFLSVAKSSCAEVRSDLYTAMDIGYLDEEKGNSLLRCRGGSENHRRPAALGSEPTKETHSVLSPQS